MQYWTWWVSGLALSAVMVFHWVSLQRMMAVSGRVTALIDRLRHGPIAPATAMSSEELLLAIQSVTAQEFGPSGALPDDDDTTARERSAGAEGASALSAHEEESERVTSAALTQLTAPAHRTPLEHFLFFFGLTLGGTLAAFLSGGVSPSYSLRADGFTTLTGGDLVSSTAILAIGGLLVGFGTRMSGGCTSGHGLCGVSRLQPGSLVATLSFFGVGILVSFGLEVLL